MEEGSAGVFPGKMEDRRWKMEARTLHFRACALRKRARWKTEALGYSRGRWKIEDGRGKMEEGSNYGGTVTGEE
jgi:hypothetical protein